MENIEGKNHLKSTLKYCYRNKLSKTNLQAMF